MNTSRSKIILWSILGLILIALIPVRVLCGSPYAVCASLQGDHVVYYCEIEPLAVMLYERKVWDNASFKYSTCEVMIPKPY